MKNYLKAINKKTKQNFTNEDFYYSSACGKRDYITEDPDKTFGNWKEIWETIKANYKPKNLFEVEIKEEYEWTEDYEHNLFAETEYYGRKLRYPVIKIITPTTKRTKYVIDGRQYF